MPNYRFLIKDKIVNILKACYRDVRLVVGNFLKGRFTSNLNNLYIVLLLILKAVTLVGAA